MQNIMESLSSLEMASILVTFLTISAIPVNSQLSSPCTISMISSFTPCINYITGSSNNGSSPTTDCCNTLKALTSVSVDCACLVLTANVPFQLPINLNIALSLPQACNMGGLPFACKASASPLPAPGPTSFPPSPSPVSPSLSPRASKALAATQAPNSAATPQLTPTFPPLEPQLPATHRVRPVRTPSSSSSSSSHKFSVSPSHFFVILAAIMGFCPH